MSATAADHELAASIATEAGRLLLEVRKRYAGDPDRLKAEGDLQSHHWIVGQLGALRPDDGLLSEEAAADPARLAFPRVWIVDPLDGTREFGEGDRDDWAVHVALVEDGFPTAGAVALPALGTTLHTGPGGWPALAPFAPGGPVRVLVSRTRPTALANALADGLAGTLVPMGSAGAKAMAVVRGDAEVYAHSGGQYEWDSAAPVAVAAAAGLHVSRLDGSPLRYNATNPWLPDLLICRPELAGAAIRIANG
ncbi:MAG: 3'(2'),5'-bisphosphate nucleotidase CysQ [Actinomycetota bacterium]|nr:3'(2'),5'-bisphosphate nucleotidase CysQ [Actinomycetota bacterium]